MSNMVRTQIYLPRHLYEQLRRRGKHEDVSMAEQIREAVARYLTNEEQTTLLRSDDPLWTLVGAGDGPPDAAEAHDRYLYGLDQSAQ